MRAVLTALAFAQLIAWKTHVEALTVLFPALGFLTVTPLFDSTIDRVEVSLSETVLGHFSGLRDQLFV